MAEKDERNDIVTHLRSGDALLCPVRQWAAIIRRIRNYPGSTDNTPVSAVWRNGRIEHITSQEMVDALRAAVISIGEDVLGFKAEDIGTHSIRSGAAMAMYLGECPVYTIMMIGRWSSDAFLRYIRKQVQQFSHNVSSRMIRFQSFFHIPDLEPQVSHLDPRQRNHTNNAETRRNIGGKRSQQARLPAFSLYNWDELVLLMVEASQYCQRGWGRRKNFYSKSKVPRPNPGVHILCICYSRKSTKVDLLPHPTN